MSSSKRKRVASSATVPVLMGSTEVLLLLRKLRTVLRRKLDADDNTDDDADDDEHDAGAAATAAEDGTGTATTGGGAQGKKERQRQRHRRVAEPWREGAKQAVAVGFNEASRLVERGAAELVLVCRATQPAALLDPLFQLCFRQDCPCVMVPCSSGDLGGALGMGRCIVFAIRKLPPTPAEPSLAPPVEDAPPPPAAPIAAITAARDFVRSVRALPQEGSQRQKKKGSSSSR